MLQQTQAATVVPYFESFVRIFPTVHQLARAGEQDVLHAWEGLGYYRRARHLHQAARILVREHAGQLPDDPEVWRRLPGIGRYTLGAILSQAFDRRLPILEANSLRVLCRLFGQRGDPRSSRVRSWLWRTAESLVPAGQPGDFNQALMELGATICTARAPRCGECPCASACKARKLGLEAHIPRLARRRATVEVREVAVVPCRNGKVLLVQRPETGRWPGLWEFPHGPVQSREADVLAAQRVLAETVSLQGEVGEKLLTLGHGVTHHRITLVCFLARCRSAKFSLPAHVRGKWLAPAELPHYPVSAPQRKLAKVVLARA